jgi:hypothetical protein
MWFLTWALTAANAAEGWGLVAPGASVYTHPNAPMPITAVPYATPMIAEVLQIDGAWAQIQLASPPTRACRIGTSPPTDVRLRLWVERDALETTVTRTTELPLGGGAGAMIRAGWTPKADDPFDAFFLARVPAAALGPVFAAEPPPPSSPPNDASAGPWTWDHRLVLGDTVLTVPEKRAGRVLFFGESRLLRVRTTDGCVELTGAPVETPVAADPDGVQGGVIGGTMKGSQLSGDPVLGLREATPVLWPDGVEAGVVHREVVLDEPASADGVTCGTWRLWRGAASAGVRVCVPTAALGEVAFAHPTPATDGLELRAVVDVGKVKHSALLDAVEARRVELAACFAKATGPTAASYAVTVSEEGRFSRIHRNDQPDTDVTVTGCLADELRTVRFPSTGEAAFGRVYLQWTAR